MAPLHPHVVAHALLFDAFIVAQILYTISFLFDLYLYTLPRNFVENDEIDAVDLAQAPQILLLYPVLREAEDTMRTTLTAIARLDYLPERRRVAAICDHSDPQTAQTLGLLRREFPFLEILVTPPTSDPSWEVVWSAWDANPNAYWWRQGSHAGDRNLPPKKTRQLIYALYRLEEGLEADCLLNYIDADSCPPTDHFRAGAAGIKRFDVLQSQNIAGNLLASLPAAWHALDHLIWDGDKYAHLTADGRQPYWVLGKGLFFKVQDLIALGGLHPWQAIEDPEVGMRFWAAGKRLGVLHGSLVEEVPETLREGIKQRRRWVCGFFQALSPETFRALRYTPIQRLKTWLIFAPCLTMWVNAIGAPTGAWALWQYLTTTDPFPALLVWLCCLNLVCLVLVLARIYVRAWRRSRLVLDNLRARMIYMVAINPLFVIFWWTVWLVPLASGFWMFATDGGLIWRRTTKMDSNHDLIRHLIGDERGSSPGQYSAEEIQEGGLL